MKRKEGRKDGKERTENDTHTDPSLEVVDVS